MAGIIVDITDIMAVRTIGPADRMRVHATGTVPAPEDMAADTAAATTVAAAGIMVADTAATAE